MKKERYIKVNDYRGIRKDTVTGNYQARKKIKGKTYSETFESLMSAIQWRNSFHPLLTNSELKDTLVGKKRTAKPSNIVSRPNGADSRFYFEEVWVLYQKQHMPSIKKQSRIDTLKRARVMFPEFFKYKMTQISAELIDHVLGLLVSDTLAKGNKRRFNFDKELQTLRALLNWYRENYDAMFVVPVLKRHFTAGIVRKKPKSNAEKMTVEQVEKFFSVIEDEFWFDFATVHFFMAGRVQEPAGLQWSSVDFKNCHLVVRDVAVWGHDKKFSHLEEMPKNTEERICFLTDRMIKSLKRRRKNLATINCDYCRESTGEKLDFVFNIDGQPLKYREIQYNYNKFLKKADLWPKFSSTHFLRKSMANIVRQSKGLDHAQDVGGWKSRETVEKVYTNQSPTNRNREAVLEVDKILSSLQGFKSGASFDPVEQGGA